MYNTISFNNAKARKAKQTKIAEREAQKAAYAAKVEAEVEVEDADIFDILSDLTAFCESVNAESKAKDRELLRCMGATELEIARELKAKYGS